jgi:hypothetical protein
MLIEVIAHRSQDVSVSILLRARAMLTKVLAPLFTACECVDPLRVRAMLIEVLPAVCSM